MQSAKSAVRFAALALLAPAAFPQQVIVVDAAGGGDHLDLQAAVDAAAVDDVLLVRTGSYTAPTLGKGLAIVADSGADVEVRGTTMVSGTPPERPVLLSGLGLRHGLNQVWHALEIKSCQGPVRLDQVTMVGGGWAVFGQGDGADAAQVVDCSDVALMRSECKGGAAGENPFGSSGSCYVSGDGMNVKSSRLATWRTLFEGGDGNVAAIMLSSAGAGGAGMNLSRQAELFGFYNLFKGGAGGDSLDFSSDWCGRGGPGLYARTHAKAFEQTCAFLGGEGGSATNFNPPKVCDDGAPTDVIGPLVPLPGPPRGLEGPRVLREGEVGLFVAYGVTGDRVSLAWSSRTAFRHARKLKGGWISPPSAIAMEPIGTIGGNGQLLWGFTAPDLPIGREARVAYVQLVTREPNGSVRLGSPITIVILDTAF